ncbi:hypothetical protein QR98_0088520 [Sarcoptes scabiei]|uniref:Uncharacterized protein n=1 Tax=Sarcoptes scabiei TaxID=52283 RepID=A0A132AHL4_SARSC|nr:hypothetical protein QR98_0088520 [Sarcoptes scabiei]
MIILIYEMILIRKHLNRRRFSASIVKHHAQQQRQQQNFVPIGSTKSNPSRFSSSSSASFMYNLDGGDQFLPPQTSFNSSTQLHRSSNQPFSLQFIPQSFQSSLVTPTITTTTKTIGSRAKESTTTTASMNRTVISYVRNNQRSKTLSTKSVNSDK